MGFYPDEYPYRDSVEDVTKVEPKGYYRLNPSTIDLLAESLRRLINHPEGCHCAACFALRMYDEEKRIQSGKPVEGVTFQPKQGDMFSERKQEDWIWVRKPNPREEYSTEQISGRRK